MIIRAYLRASTEEQDANRAKESLRSFANHLGFRIASYYIENISGTTIERPELNRLVEESETGDVLLIEKVDRLSRLPIEEWKTLKHKLNKAGIKILVMDQPLTYSAIRDDEQSSFITQVLTEFMIDLAAGMARDDYETRRTRQLQGIAKAKAEGKYKGRAPDHKLRDRIRTLLESGLSWNKTIEALGCSRASVAKVAKQLKDEKKAAESS